MPSHERLNLIAHPSVTAVTEQRELYLEIGDNDESYGRYTVLSTGQDPEASVPDGLQELKIAPEQVEITHDVGAYALRGHTPEKQSALVVVNPLAEAHSRGSVILL